MSDVKKVEALLFSAARYIDVSELSRLSGIDEAGVNVCIDDLKKKYDSEESALALIQDGSSWKMSVKENFAHLMQKVVNLTEFERPLMETLAVIAWKYPALQADIIRIRHNKAYDHLKELEERGFITRTKHGRTNKITLTQKFFEYFDLPSRKQAQEVFRNILPQNIKENVEETERQIEEKVIEEVKQIKAEEKAKKEQEIKEKKEEKEQEVDLEDEFGRVVPLEEYNADENEEGEKAGIEEGPSEAEKTEETNEEKPEETETEEAEDEELTPEVEAKIDEIIYPKGRKKKEEKSEEESGEEKTKEAGETEKKETEETEETKEKEEEPKDLFEAVEEEKEHEEEPEEDEEKLEEE